MCHELPSPSKRSFAYVQLWVPCKLGVRLCHLKLPGISDYVCRGAYAFCLATQARCGRPSRPCCDSLLLESKLHQFFFAGCVGSHGGRSFVSAHITAFGCPPFGGGIALTACKLVRAQYDDIQAMGGHFNYFDVRKKVSHSATVLKLSPSASPVLVSNARRHIGVQCIVV